MLGVWHDTPMRYLGTSSAIWYVMSMSFSPRSEGLRLSCVIRDSSRDSTSKG